MATSLLACDDWMHAAQSGCVNCAPNSLNEENSALLFLEFAREVSLDAHITSVR